jgi:hypothetical protein
MAVRRPRKRALKAKKIVQPLQGWIYLGFIDPELALWNYSQNWTQKAKRQFGLRKDIFVSVTYTPMYCVFDVDCTIFRYNQR